MPQNNNKIEKMIFDCQTKDAAIEFKEDIVNYGVSEASCKIRKVPKTEIFRLTVTNDNDEIHTVINMLMSKDTGYGMSLEEIQSFLKIKFVLPE
jgi:hypothetical protein